MKTLILVSGFGLGALFTAMLAMAFVNLMRRRHFAETAVLEDEVEKLRVENARLRRHHQFTPRERL